MDEFYFGLVKAHRRTCNLDNKKVRQVPPNWRDAVLALLKEGGYDEDGNKIA